MQVSMSNIIKGMFEVNSSSKENNTVDRYPTSFQKWLLGDV